MGAFVLAVGALLLVAGVYSMISGSGEILSERGWSAYIAGSVLLSGGVVTMALGLAVRSLTGLRLAIAAGVPALPHPAFESTPAPANSGATPIARADRSVAAVAVAPALPPFAETLAPSVVPPPPAPLAEADAHDPPQSLPRAAPLSTQPATPTPAHEEAHEEETPHPGAPEHVETHVAQPAPEPALHEDWLDRSFADLEREIAGAPATAHAEPLEPSHPQPIGSAHLAAVAGDAPVHAHDAPYEAEPIYNAVEPLPVAAAAALDEPHREEPRHEPAVPLAEPAEAEHEDPHAEHATVSAREAEPMPQHDSPVIGRYESEGTSYVMYADGSIDAQSEAGVYRFASMAELKAFIES